MLGKRLSVVASSLGRYLAAFCKQCCKKFKIDGSRVSQMRSVVLEPKSCLVLTPEDQVIKAEILEALHCKHQNYYFGSV